VLSCRRLCLGNAKPRPARRDWTSYPINPISSFSKCPAKLTIPSVSHKSAKIASIILPLQGGHFDPHYLGFFECFNQQLFFEAHEVLEELWLEQRGTPKDLFYKGLIQLAGAFVHVQKKRRRPAIALFQLARRNLSQYSPSYESLDITELQARIDAWIKSLEADPQLCGPPESPPMKSCGFPSLSLNLPQSQIPNRKS
jgi:hypothetical protein